MKFVPSSDRYSTLSIGLHWFMLMLLAAVYACAELRDFFPRGSDTVQALKTWHYTLGLSVLAVVLLRVAARALGPTPAITPAPPRWQLRLATVLQVALYALMFCLPLAGWLMLSARGTPIPFFGLQLPALIAKNKDTADFIKEVHETGAAVGYFLIGAHAAAALFHHYFLRDNTLRRMLPRSR
jgi:superoxide oxidase